MCSVIIVEVHVNVQHTTISSAATMGSLTIVEVHVNVQHTTISSAAQKCLNDEFLLPEEQRTYGSLHAKRQTFLSHFNQISIYTTDYHRNTL